MTEAKSQCEHRSSIWVAGMLPGLAAGSVILFLWATSSALGVSPDSVNYIGAANSLLDGLGFAYPYAPRTHFPPLYSLALAGVGWILNVRAESASRFLHAVVLLGNILATTALTLRASGKWRLGALGAAASLVSFPSTLSVHGMVWSEPLFVLSSLGAVLAVGRYARRPTAIRLAVAAALLIVTCLTRYHGLALAVGMILILPWAQRSSTSNEYRLATRLGIAVGLPLLLYFMINKAAFGSTTNRLLGLHSPDFAVGSALISTAVDFWVPGSLGRLPALAIPLAAVLATVAAVGLGLVILDLTRRLADPMDGHEERVLVGTSIAAYVIGLLMTIYLFDVHTPIDERTLFPASVLATVFIFATLGRIRRGRRGGLFAILLSALILLLAVPNAAESASLARNLQQHGRGFTSRAWAESQVIRCIDSLPEEWTVYSNGPDAIGFLLGRDSQWIPLVYASSSRLPNPSLESEIEAMRANVLSGGAIVTYLEELSYREHVSPLTSLPVSMQMLPTIRMKDGLIISARGVVCPDRGSGLGTP